MLDVLILGVAAAFWPLHVMAANLVGIAHPERLVLLILGLWATAVFLTWIAVRLGMAPTRATALSFALVVIGMRGVALVDWADAVTRYMILGIAVIAVAVLVVRVAGETFVRAITWGTAIALLGGPAIAFATSVSEIGDSAVTRPPAVDVALASTPDIYLVVLDGYPGLVAAAQDGPEEVFRGADALRSSGFQVPEAAWTSYWTTTLALPAVIEMGYPVTEPWEGSATVRELFELLSGSGRLYETLAKNGYRTQVIESGWTGSVCGNVDRCVPSPFVDEAMYLALRGSLISPIFDGFAGPFVEGTIAGMRALESELPALAANGIPDFVFTHLMAPHPPFFFDSVCDVLVENGRAGTDFNLPGVPTETREEYLAEQIECVNTFMLKLATMLGSDQVLIFTADHGMDRRFQADSSVVDWNQAAIYERMSVLVAVRAPGCDVGNEVVTPNLMRRVLSCYSDSPIEPLPDRMWINPMRELEELP